MPMNFLVRISLWESKYIWADENGSMVSQHLPEYLLTEELESL